MLRAFIFSKEEKAIRLRLIFLWVFLYVVLFFNNLPSITRVSEFYQLKSYTNILISTSYWFVLTIGVVLFFLKIIIPKYLLTKKYEQLLAASILSWICIFIIAMGMSYVDNNFIGPIQCNCEEIGTMIDIQFLAIYYTLVINLPISIFLMALHFIKTYRTGQREQTILLKERTDIEINTHRNKVHPEYFLRAIKLLSNPSLPKQVNQSQLILLFSNVLSYILYESNVTCIPADKEIEIARDLIDFENMLHGRSTLLRVNFTTPNAPSQIQPLLIINSLIAIFQNQTSMLSHSTELVLEVSPIDCKVMIPAGHDSNAISTSVQYIPFLNMSQK